MFQDPDNCQLDLESDQIIQSIMDDYEITNILTKDHSPLLPGISCADFADNGMFDTNTYFYSTSSIETEQLNVSQSILETSELNVAGFAHEHPEAYVAL